MRRRLPGSFRKARRATGGISTRCTPRMRNEAAEVLTHTGAEDRRLRSLRPPKPFVDPWKAHGTVIDRERRPDGTIERAMTVFLAGAECPFTCSFCDLWRYTIDGPTPPGALTKQLADALQSIDVAAPHPQRLKLYNASNFFDRRAVPAEDSAGIAALAAPFESVTV